MPALLARRLAFAGIVGPVAFGLAAALGAHLEDGYLDGSAYRPGLHAGYSQVHAFVSELAARGSGVATLMIAGFLLLGVATVVLAVAMRALWPAEVGLAGIVALSGVSTLLAGTFACDAGCPTEGPRSTSQQLHDVTSVVTFLAWLAAALLAAWHFRRSSYGRASLALAAVQLSAIAVLGFYATDRHADDPVGLVQRISLVAVGAWFVLTAITLRRSASIQPAADPP